MASSAVWGRLPAVDLGVGLLAAAAYFTCGVVSGGTLCSLWRPVVSLIIHIKTTNRLRYFSPVFLPDGSAGTHGASAIVRARTDRKL